MISQSKTRCRRDRDSTDECVETSAMKLSGMLPVLKSLRTLMKFPMTRLTMASATPEPIAARIAMNSRT